MKSIDKDFIASNLAKSLITFRKMFNPNEMIRISGANLIKLTELKILQNIYVAISS